MHEDEIYVAEDAVRELIARQFPQWREEPVRRLDSNGTVNAIFRVGEQLAARFRRRASAGGSLEREAAATQQFADACPFPAPRPVAIGAPGAGYPLPWAVQTWLPGETATPEFEGSGDFARDLARLIGALRDVDAGGRTFSGQGRGGDLRTHDEWVEECFAQSVGLLDVRLLRRRWNEFRDLPRTSADVMSHGDLMPQNLVVADGRLGGVLDTGDFAPADPALDVIAGWYLLGDESRRVFRAELGCDDLEWERSKAWAFEQCLGAIWYYRETNPFMHEVSRRALARIVGR